MRWGEDTEALKPGHLPENKDAGMGGGAGEQGLKERREKYKRERDRKRHMNTAKTLGLLS